MGVLDPQQTRHSPTFTRYYFFELPAIAIALQEGLTRQYPARDDYHVVSGDSNDTIDGVLSELREQRLDWDSQEKRVGRSIRSNMDPTVGCAYRFRQGTHASSCRPSRPTVSIFGLIVPTDTMVLIGKDQDAKLSRTVYWREARSRRATSDPARIRMHPSIPCHAGAPPERIEVIITSATRCTYPKIATAPGAIV